MSRVLFVMLHPGFIRYYEGALQGLADAGHDIHVAFEVSRSKLGEDETARRLASRSPRITCGTTPERVESVREFLSRADRTATRSGDADVPLSGERARARAWESLATTVRLLGDYLRFFEPAFAGTTKLRDRAEKRLPRLESAIARGVAGAGAPHRRLLGAMLRGLERVIPIPRAIEAFVREQRPDVLLVTPLIELGSQQVDYVKAARRLGVRSALCVASWDNLTSKGLIRVPPDHVVVWNEAQKQEATALHGVPPDRVVVTGAQLFDPWFTAAPSRSREEFCAMVGLAPARPFVLYVGSSIFIAPDEVPFVERWLAALRGAADPAVAGLAALVRPHPANARQWRTFEPRDVADASLWPPIGTDPTHADFRRDYFDSLFHSAAVVGVNTSAQIEAAIVGRPVFTIRTPEFAHAQAGTLHFRHLVGGAGVVREAVSLDEHVGQLAALLARGGDAGTNRRFVEAFIRPRGFDVPATPAFVDGITAMAAAAPPAPVPPPAWIRVARGPALGLAYAAGALAEDRPLWIYALRSAMADALAAASATYRIRDWLYGRRLGLKRARRMVWRVWYESSRHLTVRLRRAPLVLVKRLRHAGVAAKRAVRRES